MLLPVIAVAWAIALAVSLSWVAVSFAMLPGRGARGRYLLLGLAGWLWVVINVPDVALIVGMPGLRWLGQVVSRLAGKDSRRAGYAYALGLDYLRLSGKLSTRAETVTHLTAALARGSAAFRQPLVASVRAGVGRCCRCLARGGYRTGDHHRDGFAARGQQSGVRVPVVRAAR